jgi:hypothetical protein
LAHLLRQIRVRLSEQLARFQGLLPTQWLEFRLIELLEWLADQLKSEHPRLLPMPLSPNPLELQLPI